MTQTLYRRPLPEDLVPFSSPEGRAVFREALEGGTMEGWFSLAEQFHTQADPAFCGLGSLVVALNALGVDPQRLWKGPWRWFSEELLDCCVSLDQVRARGITLGELGCLARCNGVQAKVHYASEVDAPALRTAIEGAGRGNGSVIIAAYSRAVLGQTGQGHYSPVGGYSAGRNRALLLDVARFKYPPHWVAIEALHAAMLAVDPDTGRTRGFLELRPSPRTAGLLASIVCGARPWSEVAAVFTRASQRFRETPPATLDQALSVLAEESGAVTEHLAWREPLDEKHAALLRRFREELSRSPAGTRLAPFAGERTEVAAALVYTLAPSDFRTAPEPVARELAALTDLTLLGDELASELGRLREQLASLRAQAPSVVGQAI